MITIRFRTYQRLHRSCQPGDFVWWKIARQPMTFGVLQELRWQSFQLIAIVRIFEYYDGWPRWSLCNTNYVLKT